MVRGLCDAQVNNPVFIVDQLDGLGEHDKDDVEEGVRALLPLLDAPRRTKFRDGYVGVAFDVPGVV